MDNNARPKPLAEEFRVGIPLAIVLSFVTFGIYNILWNRRQFKAMNILLQRDEYHFWMWLMLSVLTLGIFHIYYEYKMGSDLERYLRENGYPVEPHLCILGLFVSLIGLTVIADALYQRELHQLIG